MEKAEKSPNIFPHQTDFYRGKVRDVYSIASGLLVMIASDRISAFDVILPHPIPFKGQVLNQVAAAMLHACADVCPNWLLTTPAPHVSIGRKCKPILAEIVVRGNLTGHSWRVYSSGMRELCGVRLPGNMQENAFFPEPIITPSTKASTGHDEDISADEIIRRNLVSKSDWKLITTYALQLFDRGRKLADKQGLILADTKYEFGKIDDEIILMDEIHTPDSSRYFEKDGFEERLSNQLKQRQLSKEFVREWLIGNNFMGRPGDVVPVMSDEWVDEISRRYIELYERLTGLQFIPQSWTDSETNAAINRSLELLSRKD